MSNVFILIDRNNADKNSIADIVSALGEIEGQVITVDEQRHVIEAAVPAHELATVKAIDGVCYVRSVFNYFSAGPAPTRAA